MSVTVDKEKKRQSIALSCQQLLLSSNIQELTISQFAKEAHIGKGTIYEYFSCKEDIVLELIKNLYKEYKQSVLKNIALLKNIEEKIFYFFNSIFDKEFTAYISILNIFLGICHYKQCNCYTQFQKELYEKNLTIFSSLIEEGINKKIFKEESTLLLKGMFNSYVGFISIALLNKNYLDANVKKEMNSFITLFLKSIRCK
jgi:AcrR family transcriptional regulator